MYYKKYFLTFLLSFSVNAFDCDASCTFENESELRNRKKTNQYGPVSTYETEISSEINDGASLKTYESVFQSEALEEFVKFCIEKKINFNLKEILDELGSDSLGNYKKNAERNKRFLTNYHVPKRLLDDLYNDLVRMIIEEKNNNQ